MKAFILTTLSLVLTSCSTLGGSLGLGSSIGATAGALIGNQSGSGNQRDNSTLQGAAIGAGLGAMIGYAGYVGKQKKDATKSVDVKFDKNTPSLSAPKVRRIWVPAQIEGEKYIDGHYMYLIEKTSAWSN